MHCPVDGHVLALHRYAKDELFPGAAARLKASLWNKNPRTCTENVQKMYRKCEESMCVFHFMTGFGPVQLLCIGEWSVQSFRTNVVVGQELERCLPRGSPKS